MKVFRDLEIDLNATQRDKFLSELEEQLSNGWTRERSKESSEMPLFYFVCNKNDQREAALLALVQRNHRKLYISNIVPREKGQLTFDEYNFILNEFHHSFIKPLQDKLNIQVTMSSDQQTLEDWISPESAEKLRRFSALANKSTGSSHPNDKERWFDFIVSIVRKDEKLDTLTLRRWLTEEGGWAPDIADELVIQYERGVALIKYYRSHS